MCTDNIIQVNELLCSKQIPKYHTIHTHNKAFFTYYNTQFVSCQFSCSFNLFVIFNTHMQYCM